MLFDFMERNAHLEFALHEHVAVSMAACFSSFDTNEYFYLEDERGMWNRSVSVQEESVTELLRRKIKRSCFITRPVEGRMGLCALLEKWFYYSMIDDLSGSGVRLVTVLMSGLTLNSRKSCQFWYDRSRNGIGIIELKWPQRVLWLRPMRQGDFV